MLFSGARPGEIAQLEIADIQSHHGIWIMDITTTLDDDDEDEDYKSVKNKNSKRVIPIHSELIKIGFLKYYNALKDSGETRLFPQAKRNSRGQMIADFSKAFGRYLEGVGVKDKSDKDFKNTNYTHCAMAQPMHSAAPDT